MKFSEIPSGLLIPEPAERAETMGQAMSAMETPCDFAMTVECRCECGGLLKFTGEQLTGGAGAYLAQCSGCSEWRHVTADDVRRVFVRQIEGD